MTINANSTLSMFDFLPTPDGENPLPLQVASKWKFALTYIDTDSGEKLYHIAEWINGISSSDQARLLWAKMKNELLITVQQLPYTSTDGKTYQMDFTSDVGLYAIAAYMKATKARPALREIKDYLAKAGAFVDAARRDPEGMAVWAANRAKGIAARNAMTDTWQQHGAQGRDYATLSEDVNQVTMDKTSVEIRKELGLKKNTPVRDHLSAAELNVLRVVEAAATTLHVHRNSQGVDELSEDIHDTSPVVAALRSQMSKRRER